MSVYMTLIKRSWRSSWITTADPLENLLRNLNINFPNYDSQGGWISKVSQHGKAQIPICITIDQVIGLVEILYSLGGVADTSKISEIVDADAGLLPNVIDVAEALGLVRLSKGDLEITNLGKDIARADSRSLKRILRELALKLEPISTIYREISVKEYMSREELEKILETFYGPERRKAFDCIINWGTYLGIFRWNPDMQILKYIRRHHR